MENRPVELTPDTLAQKFSASQEALRGAVQHPQVMQDLQVALWEVLSRAMGRIDAGATPVAPATNRMPASESIEATARHPFGIEPIRAHAVEYVGRHAPLSVREREVLLRIAAGDSNKMIARAFDLSLHTVKRHVANILAKLGVSSRGQAAACCRSQV